MPIFTTGKLYRGKFGYHFTEPLSAIVAVDDNGNVSVDGSRSEWVYGIAPELPEDAYFAHEFSFMAPEITSGTYTIDR